MQLTSTGCYSLNSTPFAPKLEPERRGECQLSLALLFIPIRAFSTKRTISTFLLQFPAVDIQLYFKRGGAIFAGTGAVIKIYASTFESNTARSDVSRMSDGLQNVPECSPCPGGGHATSRAELFVQMVQMSRSTPARSRATQLTM
jgi:hypothetical protein